MSKRTMVVLGDRVTAVFDVMWSVKEYIPVSQGPFYSLRSNLWTNTGLAKNSNDVALLTTSSSTSVQQRGQGLPWDKVVQLQTQRHNDSTRAFTIDVLPRVVTVLARACIEEPCKIPLLHVTEKRQECSDLRI